MKRFLLFVGILCATNSYAQQLFTLQGKAQGTYYIVKYVADSQRVTQAEVEALFSKMDSSLSLYKGYSRINYFNAHKSVEMDAYMETVVRKAMDTYQRTNGLFDITVKPLVDIWGFGVKRKQGVPAKDSIAALLPLVSTKYLSIKKHQLFKRKNNVEIDCNGIAQGYTTDVIADYLVSKNIERYLVDVGGELRAAGNNSQNKIWTVGIERPTSDGDDVIPSTALVSLHNKAIATSGNYRRFFDEGHTRFAHTINPKTGEALHNNIVSVTVIANDCITADAYDNVLILLGVEKGLDFVKKHPHLQLHAYYIYKNSDGNIEEKYSEGFAQYFVK
ncbi:FAD:protein FMN transferase [Chitinophaga skermanii]|nr:FAD:protein FMN transferase [Chitinophaga skermanii]